MSAYGRYFDGERSVIRDVLVHVRDGGLVLTGDGVERRVEAADVEVAEPDARGQRLLRFRSGGGCEVDEGAELHGLLAAIGHRDPPIVRWQTSWWVAGAAAVLLVGLALVAYREGVPWLAERLAKGLPDTVHTRIGEQTLALLDRTGFAPSRLPRERQDELTTRFRALRVPDGVVPSYTVHFRAGGRFGANAMALPNGDVIVTDQLVALAKDDREILAVLGHELGHVRERHGLRLFLQGSAVGVAVGLWLGDVGSTLVGVPAFLLAAKYSRDFELEADAFAAALLRTNDLPTEHLAAMLRRLEGAAGPGLSYLSSHPLTDERITALDDSAARGEP